MSFAVGYIILKGCGFDKIPESEKSLVRDGLKKVGFRKLVAIDFILVISTVILGALVASHVIPLPPTGTYSFFGVAGLIVLADTVVARLHCLMRKKVT